MKIDILDKIKSYGSSSCWQYEIRKQNYLEDVKNSGLTPEEIEKLTINDFDFQYVDKTNKEGCLLIKDFIEHSEWLQCLPARPTHRFVTILKKTGAISGAIVMATPNSFSYLLGKENRDLEKLVSRGACISWAPKNLNSWLIMNSIRWMVANTSFRLFTAYSDPEAKELGTIYQACNFLYLGQTSGTSKQYFDKNKPELGWFSDREFRKKSKYYLYAKNLGYDRSEWKTYMGKWSPNWEIVPEELKKQIKEEESKYRNSCESRMVPAKHKYAYILGKSKSETKKLKKLFRLHNPLLIDSMFCYPKIRGE